MATFNSLEDGMNAIQKSFLRFQKDSYKIEGDLFYEYDKEIREVTPIDTGRLRRYPHTQANSLKDHLLEWQPEENRLGNIRRGYVGYIYNNRKIKFKDSNAITKWDITTAIENNDKHLRDLNDIITDYFK